MPRLRARLGRFSITAGLALAVCAPGLAQSTPALSTEDFLNRLGVNTHLGGLTPSDPWNTNSTQVGTQLNYIGVRLVRDWIQSPEDVADFHKLQLVWRPDGRFWTSIAEASPAGQRASLALTETAYKTYPNLIYAVGGPNEEDDTYPQSLGATLPDSAVVQGLLYQWAHTQGVPVSQMEFGAGWTAANNWQGDYAPTNTGLKQNYVPGPADFGGGHAYVSSPGQRMGDVLKQLRADANLCTPGKPVAQTEVGAYTHAHLTPRDYGQSLVMGALDSVAAGDVAYLVYGLQDSAPEATYGFFTYPAGKANPAAKYFHTLTSLLETERGSYGPGAKPTFRPAALPATFANKTTSHLVMQKPTGEFVIADWSEQLPDENAHDDADTIRFGRKFATVSVYDVEQGMAPISVLHGVSQCSLEMEPSDTYLVVLSGVGK